MTRSSGARWWFEEDAALLLSSLRMEDKRRTWCFTKSARLLRILAGRIM